MKTREDLAELAIAICHLPFDSGTPLADAIQHLMDVQSDARKNLEQEVEELKREMETLEGWLASEIGIEEGERNAGDDPSKRYWIGADNQVYESRRQAINNAMKEEK